MTNNLKCVKRKETVEENIIITLGVEDEDSAHGGRNVTVLITYVPRVETTASTQRKLLK